MIYVLPVLINDMASCESKVKIVRVCDAGGSNVYS